GDDDGADIVILVGGIEGVDHLLLHLAGEGIELVGPVQGDGEDLLRHLILDRLIRHGDFLPYSFLCSDRRTSSCPGKSASSRCLPQAPLPLCVGYKKLRGMEGTTPPWTACVHTLTFCGGGAPVFGGLRPPPAPCAGEPPRLHKNCRPHSRTPKGKLYFA